jgi:hypothetical protein
LLLATIQALRGLSWQPWLQLGCESHTAWVQKIKIKINRTQLEHCYRHRNITVQPEESLKTSGQPFTIDNVQRT